MMKYLSDLNWWKQLSLNVGGVLTSLLAFLGVLNIRYEWFTQNSINAAIALIIAIGTLFVGSFATLANTYLTKRSKEQAQKIAKDYTEQKLEEERAELDKLKAAIAKLEAEKASAQTTPSTTGEVSATTNTAQ